MTKFFIILFSLTGITALAQEQDLTKYLKACKTAEIERVQAFIADYSFGKKPDYNITDFSTFTGLEFTTDIPGLKGYKAMGNCTIKNKSGDVLDKKMMAVMYFDKIKNHWSVFSVREVADPKSEYEISKADIEAGKFYTSKEFVYKNAAYWSLMAGQINDAKKYIGLAIDAAKESTSTIPFSTNQIDIVLKSIM